jgi:hypothetical protein
MNKLISILASTVIAVSAMMTTSGTIKTSAEKNIKALVPIGNQLEGRQPICAFTP